LKDLKDFATEIMPLHPSGLRNLVECPWRAVMTFLSQDLGDETGGPAADTGSAVHRAVQALHKQKATVADAIEVMAAEKHEYPQADLDDAAKLFLRYAADPTNFTANVILCEQEFTFKIKAAEDDPTGTPISIIGTGDQVRREYGRLRYWDVKTSAKPPVEVLRNSMHQAAAYCIGLSFFLGEQVHPGGIIMPRQNIMHIPFTWRFEDIEEILQPVRYAVSQIRRGIVFHVPSGEHCKWCHAGSPDLCGPRKRRTLHVVDPGRYPLGPTDPR
jgi:hypothetical protein